VTFSRSAVVGPCMVSFHGAQNPWRRPWSGSVLCCDTRGWGGSTIIKVRVHFLRLPHTHTHTHTNMSGGDWRAKCQREWGLDGAATPDDGGIDWKSVFESKPLGRNLLRNPAPYGMTSLSRASASRRATLLSI